MNILKKLNKKKKKAVIYPKKLEDTLLVQKEKNLNIKELQEYFSKLKINEDKKGLNNSFDDSLIDFCTNRLKFEDVKENKENNQSKNTSEKTKKKLIK